MGVQFIQVKEYDNSRELRDAIIKALDKDSHKLFYLSLYRGGEGENKYSEPEHLIIQADTCKTMETTGAFSLAFDKKVLLGYCIGRGRWESLKKEVKAVKNSMNKIEDVLGKVPVVEELRNNTNALLQAMQKCLEC